MKNISIGVPQGSVSRFVVILIYLNNIKNAVNSGKVTCYANI